MVRCAASARLLRPIAIAFAFDNRSSTGRGFLPRGLSNTCPQASATRTPARLDGQVSDKPKLKQLYIRAAAQVTAQAQTEAFEEADDRKQPPAFGASLTLLWTRSARHASPAVSCLRLFMLSIRNRPVAYPRISAACGLRLFLATTAIPTPPFGPPQAPAFAARNFSAIRTQAVAPSGIRSSLKS